MSQPAVVCAQLTRTFSNVTAVNGLNLSVQSGTILAVIGPSGCGKTTLLRLLAGFERPTAGQISIGGRLVAGAGHWLPPDKRQVGMVFQNYALFPHLTVFENVAYGLARLPRAARVAQVQRLLELVGLSAQQGRLPHELSGGQQQRVALARALAPEPAVVLLDEPFSNLDATLRRTMRGEVRSILHATGATAVFVTHDQEEALFLGDQIAVINQGHLEQVGGPEVIFQSPATRFVADFMGTTDFVPGQVVADGLATEIGFLPLQLKLPVGAAVDVAVRADDLHLALDAQAPGQIVARQFLGAQQLYQVRLPSGLVVHSLQPHVQDWLVGAAVRVRLAPGHPLACFQDGERVA